jgi:hypothetical protein
MAENVEERLAYWHQHKKVKGFRHILQGEKDQCIDVKSILQKRYIIIK